MKERLVTLVIHTQTLLLKVVSEQYQGLSQQAIAYAILNILSTSLDDSSPTDIQGNWM